ncbi:glycosyltransferase family 2 protein [Spirosoma sp. RP8]|uniref:Glycosyltransferase family 2 protein n=1 Tax=Spirosoma liriopis TaxID=2937440 RepID=A0ABT0HFV4_9BACT|nr:glycosyltransferase family 2 protein [Spirosoma liriopis]MCK8490553.1 glycosyltransferase family 2 protein [Spirosoma liriopis]
MRISVALCTYNGALYLAEQLQSIADQTQLPDELVICDDGSVDQTLTIARSFAINAPFAVHIHQNAATLGVTRNFEQALTRCTGDIIFLCDQDDVWMTGKIKQTCDFLRFHPQAKAVFSNAILLNETGLSLDNTIWDVNSFNLSTRTAWQNGFAFDINLLSNRIPGCTLALQRKLLATALPFPRSVSKGMHDWWLVLAASASNSLFFIEESLIGYRQHANQVVGTGARPPANSALEPTEKPSRRTQKLVELQDQIQFLTEVHQYISPMNGVPALTLRKVKAYQAHTLLRYQFRTTRSGLLCTILAALWKGHYHQYKRPGADWSDPWRTVVSDLTS